MVECGICGTDQSPLYCGGCASHLTLRSRINVMKVTSQLSDLRTNVSQAIEGESTPGSARGGHDGGGNEARTTHLQAHITTLQKRLTQLQAAVTSTHNKTAEIRQQSSSVEKSTMTSRNEAERIGRDADTQLAASRSARTDHEAVLEKGYRGLLHLSLGLQTKCCQDLLEIFALKKKRKKNGYEIVLGFAVIPELSQLGHYSITTINSGLERVCMFLALLASYIGIRLPYELNLPQKARPRVLIGPYHAPLRLAHSVKTMMRSSPREFHDYCQLLAMLAMDVASVALKLGVSGVAELQDLTRINQLIAQIYLRVEGLIKTGHNIQVYSGTIATDLDSLQDHIITAIDVELNGKSAEWNIVEAP